MQTSLFAHPTYLRIPVDLWWKTPISPNQPTIIRAHRVLDETMDGDLTFSGISPIPAVLFAANKIDTEFGEWFKDSMDKMYNADTETARELFIHFSKLPDNWKWYPIARAQSNPVTLNAIDL